MTQTLILVLLLLVACSSGNNTPQDTKNEGEGGTTATKETLKISTWNIYWLVNASSNERTPADYSLLQKYSTRLNADVIALQEVQDASFAKKVFGSEYDYYVSNRPGDTGLQRVGFAVKNNRGIVVSNVNDYLDLNVGNVRYGKDITISFNNKSIRLLTVHLKSGCFDLLIDPPSLAAMPEASVANRKLKNACIKLANQVAPLESWVDARATEEIPFLLLGDFNRRFLLEIKNNYDETAGIWPAIDDPGNRNPNEDLHLANGNDVPLCWGSRFSSYIDQIVVDPRTLLNLQENSFTELLYDETDYNVYRKLISDHCPLSITLNM